jgi:hypothetical protein
VVNERQDKGVRNEPIHAALSRTKHELSLKREVNGGVGRDTTVALAVERREVEVDWVVLRERGRHHGRIDPVVGRCRNRQQESQFGKATNHTQHKAENGHGPPQRRKDPFGDGFVFVLFIVVLCATEPT